MSEFKKLSVQVPNYYIPTEYEGGESIDLLSFQHIPINDKINKRLIRDLGGIEDSFNVEIFSKEEKENILERYESDKGVRIYPQGGYYKINELNGYLIDMEHYSPYELRNIDNFMDYIVFICGDLNIDFKWELAPFVKTAEEYEKWLEEVEEYRREHWNELLPIERMSWDMEVTDEMWDKDKGFKLK